MHSVDEVRAGLVYYFGSALSLRESLIPKDKPWDPKNEKHAKCLRAVLEYMEAIPDDDPLLQRLATCKHLYDKYGEESVGQPFVVPKDEWSDVIHCRTEDPAAWFRAWAESLADDPYPFLTARDLRPGRLDAIDTAMCVSDMDLCEALTAEERRQLNEWIGPDRTLDPNACDHGIEASELQNLLERLAKTGTEQAPGMPHMPLVDQD